MPMPKTLDEMLQPENIIKIDYGPNNPNTKVIHIRAVVDLGMYVFCHWYKRKQYWHYQVESYWYFEARRKRLVYKGKEKIHTEAMGAFCVPGTSLQTVKGNHER